MEDPNEKPIVAEDTSVEKTDTGEETTATEKPSETPEAKHARLLRQTNRVRKDLGLPPLVEALVEKPQPQPKADQKKGFDYAEKAYLKSEGVDKADFDFVKEVMDSTGKTLDQVLESKYFQAELKERKDLRMTEAATPSGSKRAGNTTRDQVEYWIQKGELPPADQVQLRRDVVNARMKQEKDKSQFTDTPVVGK